MTEYPPPQALGRSSCWIFGDLVLTRTVQCATQFSVRRSRPVAGDEACYLVVKRGVNKPPAKRLLNETAFVDRRDVDAGKVEIQTLYLPLSPSRPMGARTRDLKVIPSLSVLLADFLDVLVRRLPTINEDDGPNLASATRAMVAACVADPATQSPVEAPLPQPVERARRIVHQNIASPDFGPEQLATRLAMSRSKAYRLFSPFGGVKQFIMRERLLEARRRLLASDESRPIHAIGSDVGFADHSTFSRAFRREFGYSPLELRRQAVSGPSTPW